MKAKKKITRNRPLGTVALVKNAFAAWEKRRGIVRAPYLRTHVMGKRKTTGKPEK